MKSKEYIIEQKVYRHRRKRKVCRKRQQRFVHLDRLCYVCSPFVKGLIAKDYVQETMVEKIVFVPMFFSFKKDFENSLRFFKKLLSTYMLGGGKNVKVDFSNCRETSIACFMLFDLIVEELLRTRFVYNMGLSEDERCNKNFSLIGTSKYDDKTNKYLLAFRYCKLDDVDNVDLDESFLALDLIRGKWRKYSENLKGLAAHRIVEFIKVSMDQAKGEIKPEVANAVERMISEVLTNAEEHSLKGTEWFVNGIGFHECQHDMNVVEMNLSIINFGCTMYEGFESTKEQNAANYKVVDDLYQKQSRLFSFSKHFSRESLFMLYMLNDGISRLKYQDDGRGNGTMEFVDNFIWLGDKGVQNNLFTPQLNIISGSTILTCDSHVRPTHNDGISSLYLNKNKTFSELPDSNYLCSYGEYFPGTIMECKIYLNKDFITVKK
mgnify:FL=1